MITLLTFPAGYGVPSLSPFCVKAMCLLEMAGEDWSPEYLGDPSKMPYNKLPVVRIDGTLLAESGNIQTLLEERGADFYPGLSIRQRAEAQAIQRMAEESLRLALVYERWVRDEGWEDLRKAVFSSIPFVLRGLIANKVRKSVRAGLISHGYARLSEDDLRNWTGRDLATVCTLLDGNRFLFGDRPTAADASLIPVLDMLANLPASTWVRERVRGDARLMDYIAAGRAEIYPQDAVRNLRTDRTAMVNKAA